MADADLEIARTGQGDDVGRLLEVGRQRLLDEDVAAGLECVHGRPVVGQVRAEDRQGVGGRLPEQLAMIGERRHRGRRRAPAPAARSASARAAARSGSAQPTIATPSSARSRSRWIRAAWPQPAIPIRTTGVPIVDTARPLRPDPAANAAGFRRSTQALLRSFGYGLVAWRLHPSNIPASRQESICHVNP